MRLIATMLLLISALWTDFSAADIPPSNVFSASLEILSDSARLTTDNAVNVSVTITNQTDRRRFMLRWYTPFEEISGDIFEVKIEGERVAYMGRLVKRARPVAEDFLMFEPYESKQAVVDLSALYDLTSPGNFSAQLSTVIQDTKAYSGEMNLFSSDGAAPARLSSDAIEFALGQGKFVSKSSAGAGVAQGATASTTYRNCSNSRKSTLASALKESRTIAKNAHDHLTKSSDGGSRYKTWYGTHASDRYGTVKSNFGKISGRLVDADITFDCNCSDNDYAYVYPSRPYEIWLCNAFWTAPANGRDSQSGTLVHEMSHFNVVAGTDDYGKDESDAKKLAKDDPDTAIDAANNHEYFAEN